MEKITVKYKKGFVAFIDLLGFKEMIYNANPVNNEKVENYLNIVDEQLKKLDELNNFKSIVISDSIILSMEISENDIDGNIGTLSLLCNAIKIIQQNLAKKDIWIRGAISYGDIYFDNERKQVIGEGYINAYLLESNYAIYPRVILDNKIVKFLQFKSSEDCISGINGFGEKILYSWKRNASSIVDIDKVINGIKKDIPLFIDFIEGLNESEIYEISLLIISNANKNIKTYPKYLWLAQYIISKRGWGEESTISNLLKEV